MVNKFKANKDLGQHFLKNESDVKKICNTIEDSSPNLIEIGPGPGVLTKELISKNLPLIVVEKDSRFIEHLKAMSESIQVYNEDALKFNLADLNLKNVWLVSNLPYNISVALMMNFIEYDFIDGMTLMFQKEVGDKFLITPKSNLLSMIMNPFYKTSRLMNLKPGAFNPPPEVDSTVIVFKKNVSPLINPSELLNYKVFVKHLYSFKRKQIKGNLKYKKSHDIALIFKKYDISLTARAQELNLDQVVALYKEFENGN